MGIIAAIVGGIGGICAIVGIITVVDVLPDPIIKVLGSSGEWMFWFILAGILMLGTIALSHWRGPGAGYE